MHQNVWMYEINIEESGSTVKEILKKQMKLSTGSITRLKQKEEGIRILRHKEVLRVCVREKVQLGDYVCILLDDVVVKNEIIPVEGKIDVLYEDENYIIVNKPSGMVTHPCMGHKKDSLCNYVRAYLDCHDSKANIHVVGRLDMDTSGVVTIAKNSIAAEQMQKIREADMVQKEYIAFVKGHIKSKEGRICVPMIEKRQENGKLKMQACRDRGGKEAETRYLVRAQRGKFTEVLVKIKTGRMHQIRFHFSEVGHPLLGDTIYGEKTSRELSRTALHAWRVSFLHPFTGINVSVEAKLQEDMSALL